MHQLRNAEHCINIHKPPQNCSSDALTASAASSAAASALASAVVLGKHLNHQQHVPKFASTHMSHKHLQCTYIHALVIRLICLEVGKELGDDDFDINRSKV